MKFLHELIALNIECVDGIKKKTKMQLCTLYSDIKQKIARDLIIYETPLLSEVGYRDWKSFQLFCKKPFSQRYQDYVQHSTMENGIVTKGLVTYIDSAGTKVLMIPIVHNSNPNEVNGEVPLLDCYIYGIYSAQYYNKMHGSVATDSNKDVIVEKAASVATTSISNEPPLVSKLNASSNSLIIDWNAPDPTSNAMDTTGSALNIDWNAPDPTSNAMDTTGSALNIDWNAPDPTSNAMDTTDPLHDTDADSVVPAKKRMRFDSSVDNSYGSVRFQTATNTNSQPVTSVNIANVELESDIHSNAMLTDQDIARRHYDNLDRSDVARHASFIYHLRNVNGYVKTTLITNTMLHCIEYKMQSTKLITGDNSATNQLNSDPITMHILDLCCGHGGDLRKWYRFSTNKIHNRDIRVRYTGIDISQGALNDLYVNRLLPMLEQNKNNNFIVDALIRADMTRDDLYGVLSKETLGGEVRHGLDCLFPMCSFGNSMRSDEWQIRYPFAHFKKHTISDTENQWKSKSPPKKKSVSRDSKEVPNGYYDIISCQFSFHYMCQSEDTIHHLFEQIASLLHRNSQIIITTIDSRMIIHKIIQDYMDNRRKEMDRELQAGLAVENDHIGVVERKCDAGVKNNSTSSISMVNMKQCGSEYWDLVAKQHRANKQEKHLNPKSESNCIIFKNKQLDMKDIANNIHKTQKDGDVLNEKVNESGITLLKISYNPRDVELQLLSQHVGVNSNANSNPTMNDVAPSIDMDAPAANEVSGLTPFGFKYYFQLYDTPPDSLETTGDGRTEVDSAAVNAPEWLVPYGQSDAMQSIAARYGLRCTSHINFHDYVTDQLSGRSSGPEAPRDNSRVKMDPHQLLKQMHGYNSANTVTDAEWEIIGLYCVMTFELIDQTDAGELEHPSVSEGTENHPKLPTETKYPEVTSDGGEHIPEHSEMRIESSDIHMLPQSIESTPNSRHRTVPLPPQPFVPIYPPRSPILPPPYDARDVERVHSPYCVPRPHTPPNLLVPLPPQPFVPIYPPRSPILPPPYDARDVERVHSPYCVPRPHTPPSLKNTQYDALHVSST